MELVNVLYPTDFDILYLPLVRNTEKQFTKGVKYGLLLLIVLSVPFVLVKYFLDYSIFSK
jgi:hypothetical protein